MGKKTGIACEAGRYENFSGVIMWGETEGVVENAKFVLRECGYVFDIWFLGGTWITGVFAKGAWFHGEWRDGVFKDSARLNATAKLQ